jgi:hypothetical protein
MDALVLVENEVTAGGRYDHWQDVTGERYQFPNQYRNKIVTGRPFVYYRGVRRADGTRGVPEYFGCGTVGSTYLDPTSDPNAPKSRRKWICEIDDYRPFPMPVPARYESRYIEDIRQNFWGVAVRELPELAYRTIIDRARLPAVPVEIPASQLCLPPVDHVSAELVTSLLIPRRPGAEPSYTEHTRGETRRSRYSVALGSRGEEVVFEHLRKTLPPSEAATLRWVAASGERPGWDIEYVSSGELIAVEVKATGGPAFLSFELTGNEWAAATRLGAAYRLVLVAHVTTRAPQLQIIEDPAALVRQGRIAIEPALWRVVWSAST